MAMGWLKGLVAPTFSGDNQQQQQQQGIPGMQPPMGGMPPQGGSPYGAGQMPPPGTPPIGAPGGPAPYDQGGLPNAMQWSTGTKTQGSGGGISGGGISGGGAAPPQQGAQSLEARCAQLEHDIQSMALFARTLLTMLEEGKLVTREQFDATKHRLDMLDGKLDDR